MNIPKGGIDFSNCEEDEETGKNFSSVNSKPIYIRWIRICSKPYCKIMYSVLSQTIFNDY